MHLCRNGTKFIKRAYEFSISQKPHSLITLKSLHSFLSNFSLALMLLNMSFNLYIGSAVGFRITEAVAPIWLLDFVKRLEWYPNHSTFKVISICLGRRTRNLETFWRVLNYILKHWLEKQLVSFYSYNTVSLFKLTVILIMLRLTFVKAE